MLPPQLVEITSVVGLFQTQQGAGFGGPGTDDESTQTTKSCALIALLMVVTTFATVLTTMERFVKQCKKRGIFTHFVCLVIAIVVVIVVAVVLVISYVVITVWICGKGRSRNGRGIA